MQKAYVESYQGAYLRLVDGNSEAEKSKMFRQAISQKI